MRPLRALSWNLHGFVGQDGRFDPERACAVLAALDPDVAALQEVVGEGYGVDGFALLRATLPAHVAIEAEVERRTRGAYGQLLLSRYAVQRRLVFDLSVARREPRRAIDALIDTPGRATRVICAHLGLAGPERRFQVGELCGLVAADPAVDVLLLGDINDWRVRGFAERRLSPLLGAGTRHRTYPAAWPLLPLDRIWFRSAHRVMRTRVVREAGRASDHLPLLAEIRWMSAQDVAAASARSIHGSSVPGSPTTRSGRA